MYSPPPSCAAAELLVLLCLLLQRVKKEIKQGADPELRDLIDGMSYEDLMKTDTNMLLQVSDCKKGLPHFRPSSLEGLSVIASHLTTPACMDP